MATCISTCPSPHLSAPGADSLHNRSAPNVVRFETGHSVNFELCTSGREVFRSFRSLCRSLISQRPNQHPTDNVSRDRQSVRPQRTRQSFMLSPRQSLALRSLRYRSTCLNHEILTGPPGQSTSGVRKRDVTARPFADCRNRSGHPDARQAASYHTCTELV